jgi:tetratricopeptide (TPR) repeat protein
MRTEAVIQRRAVLAGLGIIFLLLLAVISGLLAISAARQSRMATLVEASAEEPGFGDRWNPDWHLKRGQLLARQGDIDGSEAALQRAIELRPRWPTAWVLLAISRLDRGDLTGLELADTALTLGPNDSHLFVSLWPRWLFHWRQLSEAQKQQVLILGDRLIGRFPDWTIEVADRYGQLNQICDRLESRSRAELACLKAGWTAAPPGQ